MTAIVYLYVLLDRGGSTQAHRTPHPNYASCFTALDHIRIVGQPGADEVAVAWCGGDQERFYGSTWWKDPVKASE